MDGNNSIERATDLEWFIVDAHDGTLMRRALVSQDIEDHRWEEMRAEAVVQRITAATPEMLEEQSTLREYGDEILDELKWVKMGDRRRGQRCLFGVHGLD